MPNFERFARRLLLFLEKSNFASPPAKPGAYRLFVIFEDICKIMEYAAPHVEWSIQLVCYLEVRHGPCELFSLKWSDIDFERKEAHVYASKTNTHRPAYFTDDFSVLLQKYKEISTTEYLVEFEENPIIPLKKACKRAGITYPIRIYDFRHLYATMLLNAGADLAAVSKLMGHSHLWWHVSVS